MGVAGANRTIFTESDAYFYNLDDPAVRSYIIPFSECRYLLVSYFTGTYVELERTSCINYPLKTFDLLKMGGIHS